MINRGQGSLSWRGGLNHESTQLAESCGCRWYCGWIAYG
jgi:hypothetical protein